VVEAGLAAASASPEGTTVVVALEGAPTRALSSGLRKRLGFAKDRVHALAYWKRS
jgi:NADPH-dependent ferric siderophore reductase